MASDLRASRRDVLKVGVLAGGVLLGFDKMQWQKVAVSQKQDPFSQGKQLGTVDFVYEGPAQMDTVVGTELDGRLYTDLSRLTPQDALTSTERFYIRTRASKLLPDARSWQISVDGLIDQPFSLTLETLNSMSKPMGRHLMECAGNTRIVSFGMISVANWAGVPLLEVLHKAKLKARATRVLITGFDQYTKPSATSVPGASWVFSLEELEAAGGILATKMNEQPLTKDHGAPVRLLVPGWYGCASIKWVNNISLVDDSAEITSQMQEYAVRTLQDGIPQLAKEYRPGSIDLAAMPVRIEKWIVGGKLAYRVIGILWGGSQTVRSLKIQFNPDEEYVGVSHCSQDRNDPWTIWTHAWSPKAPGVYAIRLRVTDPPVLARKLDSGYYVRSVEITEV